VVAEEAFAERLRNTGQLPVAGGEADLASRIAAQRRLVEAGMRQLGSLKSLAMLRRAMTEAQHRE